MVEATLVRCAKLLARVALSAEGGSLVPWGEALCCCVAGVALDTWSIGAVIYELYTGAPQRP